jgi:hypothetical protein
MRGEFKVYSEDYPSRQLLELIGDKWTPIVLYILGGGTKRYGELQRHLPDVSKKMLTQTLRALEEGGAAAEDCVCRGATQGRVRPDAARAGLLEASRGVVPVGAQPSRRTRRRSQEPKEGTAGMIRLRPGPLRERSTLWVRLSRPLGTVVLRGKFGLSFEPEIARRLGSCRPYCQRDQPLIDEEHCEMEAASQREQLQRGWHGINAACLTERFSCPNQVPTTVRATRSRCFVFRDAFLGQETAVDGPLRLYRQLEAKNEHFV